MSDSFSRLPSLNALRSFEAAARYQSVTKAAEELHVTPAAVSHQLRALEEELGTSLFVRIGRRVTLTEAGRAGLPILQDAFDMLADAARRMRQDDQRYLTVSVSPSLCVSWLVPRLHRFREIQPDIDIRLDTSDRWVDFNRDMVDVAIRYSDGSQHGLASTRLIEEERFPVCSPGLASGETGERPPLLEPNDLRHHTLLHVEWGPSRGQIPNWKNWLRLANVNDIQAHRGTRFTHVGMAIQAAIQGQGVALGSTLLSADALLNGLLVRPFTIIMSSSGYAEHLVCPLSRREDPRIIAFRDWLLAETQTTCEMAEKTLKKES